MSLSPDTLNRKNRWALRLRGRWPWMVVVAIACAAATCWCAASLQSARRADMIAKARQRAADCLRHELQPAEAALSQFVERLPRQGDADVLQWMRSGGAATKPVSEAVSLAERLSERRGMHDSLARILTGAASSRPADANMETLPLSAPSGTLALRIEQDPQLSAGLRRLNECEQRYNGLRSRYTEAHPEVRLANVERAEAHRAWTVLLTDLDRQLSSEMSELSTLHAQALAGDADWDERHAALARLVPQYISLCDGVDSARSRWEALQLAALAAMRIDSVVSPLLIALGVAGAVVGFAMSLAFGIWNDRRHSMIRSAGEARRRLGLRVWADVPRCGAPPLARIDA